MRTAGDAEAMAATTVNLIRDFTAAFNTEDMVTEGEVLTSVLSAISVNVNSVSEVTHLICTMCATEVYAPLFLQGR